MKKLSLALWEDILSEIIQAPRESSDIKLRAQVAFHNI